MYKKYYSLGGMEIRNINILRDKIDRETKSNNEMTYIGIQRSLSWLYDYIKYELENISLEEYIFGATNLNEVYKCEFKLPLYDKWNSVKAIAIIKGYGEIKESFKKNKAKECISLDKGYVYNQTNYKWTDEDLGTYFYIENVEII